MVDRLTSGHPRLDRILGGGFIAPSLVLLAGLPGTGKTVLAQQYAFANGTEHCPAVFLTTLTEPLSKVLRFAEGLSFFDVDRVGRSVVFEDLGTHLDDGGLEKALARITEIVERAPCSLLVIDSFRALRHAATDPGEFEGFVHELAGRLAGTGTMAMWLGEYSRDELAQCPELAVADAALVLATEEVGQRESRELRVAKLRGSDYMSGAHAYRIGSDGIDPFPRLSEVDARRYPLTGERTSSGIEGLDELLAEGYWPGSSTLVAGPSGCGKTVLGLQFVFTGARQGEPGVFASLQENEVQLERMIERLGWRPDLPGVHLRCDSPNDIYIDQWFYQLFDTIEACGARRLVIDSLGDLAATCRDDKRFREFVYSLLSRCSRAGISSIVSYETPELFEQTRLFARGVSHLSDNVILLQYLPQGSVLRRALTVLKTRASSHLPQVRVFEITQGGISVGEPINPRWGAG